MRKRSKQIHAKVIKTSEEHQQALARIEELFISKPGTPEGDELELWLLLVEKYEQEEFPIDLPNPIEAIRFRMEQAKLKQKDLIPIFGSKSKVSEVLSGKRELSVTMIRKLVSELGIPAAVFLQEPVESIDNTDFLAMAKTFPIKEMYKRGWLKGIVESIQELRDQLDDVLIKFAAAARMSLKHPVFNRRSTRHDSKLDEMALLAWQIRVMSLAANNPIPVYRSGTVTGAFLQQVAKLSFFDNGPNLAKEFLRKNGIHLIIERHLPKTFLDGAAMRPSDNCRIVALTLRHDRLDNFWFVLLHELAHISIHIDSGKYESIFDDLDQPSTNRIEDEADKMASDAIISEKFWKQASFGLSTTEDQICEFAKRLQIHPALIAGRIRFEQGNFKIFTRLLGLGCVRKQFES